MLLAGWFLNRVDSFFRGLPGQSDGKKTPATIQYPWSSRNGKGHTKSGCPDTDSAASIEPASSSIKS